MVVIGNTKEAKRLADRLGCRVVLLGIDHWPDGEVSMNLNCEEIPSEAIVYYQFEVDEPFDAQILRLVALLRCVKSGQKVQLVLPYFPYARSLPWSGDMVVASVEPLLVAIREKVSQLFTVDLHCENQVLQSYIGRARIVEVSLRETITGFLRNKWGELVLVGPDKGSERRVRRLAEAMGAQCLIMGKQRRSATEVSVAMKYGDRDKTKWHVIVDDIVSTGGTMRAAADLLRQWGVEQVACVVTHNVASAETLRGFELDAISVFYSNTLAREEAHFDVMEAITEAVGIRVR